MPVGHHYDVIMLVSSICCCYEVIYAVMKSYIEKIAEPKPGVNDVTLYHVLGFQIC